MGRDALCLADTLHSSLTSLEFLEHVEKRGFAHAQCYYTARGAIRIRLLDRILT